MAPEPPGGDRRVYLDHAATTPIRDEVLEAMRRAHAEYSGNPSSLHGEGKRAREALEGARGKIREALAARGFHLHFTSGGTEADNLAVLGAVLAARGRRPHVIASAVEHAAVLATAPVVERLGGELTLVPVDRDGRVSPAAVEAALRSETVLVSVMAANNEVGTLEPVAEIGRLARSRGVLFHTDAVQLLGKVSLASGDVPADLVTISSHKIGGPKGIAGLFVREGVRIEGLIRGGEQEDGLRAGTENVAAAVGFAGAVTAACAELGDLVGQLEPLRDRLRAGIAARFPSAAFNTPECGALPTILGVSFPGVEGEALVGLLDWHGVAASTGSACNAGARKASHVLRAMGRSDAEIRGSVRFSFGRSNRAEDIPRVLEALGRSVGQLERIAPPLARAARGGD
jgi:cysteine desulfurase